MNIAIIGGGASGLICAISAMHKAKSVGSECSVTVFEQNSRVGKKLLSTGNGRCNMLNTDSSPYYFSNNNFHSYAVKKFNAQSNIDFFNSLGLYTKTDSEGRVYPLSNQATTVLDALRLECERCHVKTVTDCEIKKIKPVKDGFILNNDMYFNKIVLACGGKASVKNFNGYELLSQLGHKITEISPSLSKLNVKNPKEVKPLQGIRHKVKLTLNIDGRYVADESGEILFTNYGLSGIAVMQLSAYITRMKKKSSKVIVNADLAPEHSFDFIKTALKRLIEHDVNLKNEYLLSGFMPKKIGEAVIKSLGFDCSGRASDFTDENLTAISKRVKKYPFEIESVRLFEDAQVTAGGADTKYFNPETMQSKLFKDFYAIGEVLDVDGLCGGYNLMWAWSSGRVCGEALIK